MVIEQCASFRSVKGQLYFDGDDDDDFFLFVRIPFVIRQIYFYGLLHITFYIPPSCRKKKRENVPLYFVCVKNHTTQIHSSLFHTIQILIQILLSFKPFPLSFALGVWTCWWQSGPVCCKWWVVKVSLVVGGWSVCVGEGEGGGGVGSITISCFLQRYVPEKSKEWFCYIYTRRCLFIYLFYLRICFI